MHKGPVEGQDEDLEIVHEADDGDDTNEDLGCACACESRELMSHPVLELEGVVVEVACTLTVVELVVDWYWYQQV